MFHKAFPRERESTQIRRFLAKRKRVSELGCTGGPCFLRTRRTCTQGIDQSRKAEKSAPTSSQYRSSLAPRRRIETGTQISDGFHAGARALQPVISIRLSGFHKVRHGGFHDSIFKQEHVSPDYSG